MARTADGSGAESEVRSAGARRGTEGQGDAGALSRDDLWREVLRSGPVGGCICTRHFLNHVSNPHPSPLPQGEGEVFAASAANTNRASAASEVPMANRNGVPGE